MEEKVGLFTRVFQDGALGKDASPQDDNQKGDYSQAAVGNPRQPHRRWASN
jgi:hypothetical protein